MGTWRVGVYTTTLNCLDCEGRSTCSRYGAFEDAAECSDFIRRKPIWEVLQENPEYPRTCDTCSGRFDCDCYRMFDDATKCPEYWPDNPLDAWCREDSWR